jgi:probable phosphoglycerate mutase
VSGTTLGLLRHFPTDWNGEGRMQGRVDRPLTAAARALLADLRPPAEWAGARVLASPLRRARDTAAALWPEHEIDPRLTELDWGAWEGRRRVDLAADPATGYRDVETWGWDHAPPGGESPAAAWARVAPALAEIAAAPGADDRPTVIVAHRGLIRVILARAWVWGFDRPEPFAIKRGRINVVALGPDGAPRQPLPHARLAPR